MWCLFHLDEIKTNVLNGLTIHLDFVAHITVSARAAPMTSVIAVLRIPQSNVPEGSRNHAGNSTPRGPNY
jgi:hypothetical protein